MSNNLVWDTLRLTETMTNYPPDPELIKIMNEKSKKSALNKSGRTIVGLVRRLLFRQ